MGKKGLSKKGPAATSGPQMSVTLREASTGKRHTNTKSSLKLQHIKNLAVWASRDAAIPSLGAFFGHHLAASSEAFGAPVDPSLFTCQRCESILHPGYNCTIRIEKNKKKARQKGKKTTHHPQNNIVYTCHFCSHRNTKRGTIRNTSQPKVKPHPKPNNQRTISTVSSSDTTKNNIANTITAPLVPATDESQVESHRDKSGIVEVNETLKVKDNPADIKTPDRGKMGLFADNLEVKNSSDASGPANPLTRPTLTLLETKMKKRNRSGSKKKVTPESTPIAEKTSKRRRRKSWTSLSEIADGDENEKKRKLMNLTVPFFMQ